MAHPMLSSQILFDSFGVVQWVVETPELFGKYVQELYEQTEGAEGDFVLSEDDKILSIPKEIDIIMNPLQIDINNRKILGKLYQELSVIANEEMHYPETQKILSELQKYFYSLEEECDYLLEIEQEISITELIKSMGARITRIDDNYFENAIQYMKIVSSLLKKRVIVFINASSYYSSDQINSLYENTIHNELRVLLIECADQDFDFPCQKYIIDKDQCEI